MIKRSSVPIYRWKHEAFYGTLSGYCTMMSISMQNTKFPGPTCQPIGAKLRSIGHTKDNTKKNDGDRLGEKPRFPGARAERVGPLSKNFHFSQKGLLTLPRPSPITPQRWGKRRRKTPRGTQITNWKINENLNSVSELTRLQQVIINRNTRDWDCSSERIKIKS